MLDKKHVVIVGGSSGMGLEVARRAKILGATLTLVARRKEKLEATAQELKARSVVGDIVSTQVGDWASKIEGPIHHLYFSAGSFMAGPFLESDLHSYRVAIEARLWGPAKLVQALHNKIDPAGSVTFTGGISTLRPNRGSWITNIGTAIADQMARALAIELAPLRFNTVAPGFVITPMWDFLTKEDRDGYIQNITEKTPTQRLATADNVALAVIGAMTNPGVNGQVLYVDGGYTLA